LWEELTEQAHKDGKLPLTLTVKDIMDTWTLKKGYPIVQIKRNATENKLYIQQKWFLLNPLNKIQYDLEEFSKYKWYIPFTHTTKEELEFAFDKTPTWFDPKTDELEVDLYNTTADSWYIANIKHAGFYRVNYDQENWNLLIDQLKTDHKLIDSVSRGQLLDDAFTLGRAEVIDQTTFLSIAQYLENEENPLPFVTALNGLGFINNFISNDFEAAELFKDYYKKLMLNTYNRLNWTVNNPEDTNEISLLMSSIQVMCSNGYQDCIDRAKEKYDDWYLNDEPLKDFKNVVLQTVMRYANEEDWRKLYEKALKTTDNSEKLRLFRGLASTRNYNLLKFLLSKTSDATVVRTQDETSLIASIASNSVGTKLAYDYLEENWDMLIEKYGSVSFTLPTLVTSITNKLNTKYDLKRVEYFIATHYLGVTTEAFQTAVENINTNIRWTERNVENIKKWLQNNN
jgi:aminopeptidase N